MKTNIPLTCDEMRELIGEFLSTAPTHETQRLWDIITCQRGPDSPSERPDMTGSESSAAYALRRKRKRATVEVIRAQSFSGVVGGAARYRTDIKYVTLPPQSQWDHFDRHVEKAARALGLEVKIKEESEEKRNEVKVEMVPPKKQKSLKESSGTFNGFGQLITPQPPEEKAKTLTKQITNLENLIKKYQDYSKMYEEGIKEGGVGCGAALDLYKVSIKTTESNLLKLKQQLQETEAQIAAKKQTIITDSATGVQMWVTQ